MLFDTYSNGKFDNVVSTKLSNWKPALFMVLQEGYQAQVTISFKYYLTCRGVRIKDMPSDNNNDTGVKLPADLVGEQIIVQRVVRGFPDPNNDKFIDLNREKEVLWQ